MTLPLNIYINNGGQLLLGTKALSNTVADSFRLYSAPAAGGPFTPAKDFPNAPDKTLYAGNALVRTTRAALGYALTDPIFLKITSLLGGVESAIGASDLTTVPPEGAESHDDMREDITQAAQIHGYNEVTGRWERLLSDGGGLVVVATLDPTGLATEAKQDAQITILTSIDAGIPAALGPALASASMPVTIATDQFPLPVLDIFATSQQTDVPITTVAADVAQSPAITTVLAGRKMIVLQNNSTRDILLGDGTLQGHIIGRNGGFRAFSGGPALSVYARVAAATATLNVWEFA